MIQKTEKTVITFHTTTDAMAMEQLCRKHGAEGRLIPVPRTISAGCGLAWCVRPQQEAALLALLDQSGIAWQGVHRCML